MLLDPAVSVRAREVAPQLARTTACTLAASGAAIAAALALASATSHVLQGYPGVPWAPLALATAALLSRGLLLWLRDLSALDAGQRLTAVLRERLLRHMSTLGPGHQWTGGPAQAHLLVVDGGEHLKGYVGNYLPQLLTCFLVPALIVTVLASKDLTVAALVVLTVLVVPTAGRAVRRLLGERSRAHWEAYGRYADKISDSVAGLETLAGLGAAERRGLSLTEEADRLRQRTTAMMNVSLSSYLAIGSAMLAGTAGATCLAAWHVAQGRLASEDAVLTLFLSAECFRPLLDLQGYWHEGFYGINAARQIEEFLSTEPSVRDTGNAVLGPQPPALEIRNLSFCYPGARRDALSRVSATIPAGRTTAVVGASGAGKSTLISLLLRDHDPQGGSITVIQEGKSRDLRELSLASLRAGTARVSQEVVLLDGSLRDNLIDAAPAASPGELKAALRRSRVEEFLPSLPQGLDSPVGEGGRLLSGGQRQRVALARALLMNAPLLVLDEATSALDGENEALVTAALRDNGGTATIVVVAHRLSTVRHADHVLVLDGGRVVEEGSPATLEARSGLWSAMVQAHRVPDNLNQPSFPSKGLL